MMIDQWMGYCQTNPDHQPMSQLGVSQHLPTDAAVVVASFAATLLCLTAPVLFDFPWGTELCFFVSEF